MKMKNFFTRLLSSLASRSSDANREYEALSTWAINLDQLEVERIFRILIDEECLVQHTPYLPNLPLEIPLYEEFLKKYGYVDDRQIEFGPNTVRETPFLNWVQIGEFEGNRILMNRSTGSVVEREPQEDPEVGVTYPGLMSFWLAQVSHALVIEGKRDLLPESYPELDRLVNK